ncbi:MAG: aminopeptidase P N-terminal domain-containing protein [Betaproteobacteria bacterium]|nr:aminopeptidase P N-terminal domain-containing protein [Betaproteobacteria bacterium]
MISKDALDAHAARRNALLAAMGEGIALIPTSPEATRNRDSLYPFRHDSYFYYLTGFAEPEAVLVLVAGKSPRTILFCREKNLEREIWDGYRHGPEGARATFGFDEAQPIAGLEAALPQMLSDQPSIYTFVGADPVWNGKISAALNGVRALARTGVSAPSVVHDARALLDAQRLLKDDQEVALMRRAGEISSLAHIRAMERTRPGQFEYQVEAELLHEFVRFGAREQAYSAIVASGANACVLHYRENNRQMADGDLLLIDAGCEFSSYASDITRTFPVNGKFTGPQKAVYELVLEAQQQCIAQVKPGKPFNAYHETAVNVLAQGLIDLGLCTGSLAAVIETKAYSQFYMHRAGHWLGLDVHDAGDYRIGGSTGHWQTLAPGMVLTVEPGAYIRAADNVPEAFWDIGVRIEDDLLVTAAGNENLTARTPKSVADVEAACRR